MTRVGWIASLGSLVVAVPLFAQTTPPATSTKTETTVVKETVVEREAHPAPARNAAVALLRSRVESIDWIDKPFEEVIKWLKDQGEGRVNIIVRWGPLGVESVDKETLVSLSLTNTSVADVLNETVRLLSEDNEVSYRGHGNTITVSTKQDFGREMYVRVYDVTDLLMRVPDFGQSAPQIDLQQVGQSSGGGGGQGGGGQSVFQGGGGQGGGQEDEESGAQGEQQVLRRLGELRNVIIRTISPESWEDVQVQVGGGGAGGSVPIMATATQGGGKGRISIYNRSLIVYNTIEVHEAIAGGFSFDD